MNSNRASRKFCQVAATALLLSTPLRAEESHGWHIVRPGDTLEKIAAKYLGRADLWPEIRKLNPGIDDPHWIFPGRKMRVVLERPSAVANAQITALSRRVEARPAPVSWQNASEGDLLLDRDSLRTFSKASARLLFDDGTTATLSEDSLVFIRRQSQARSSKPIKEIEIQLGQADLASRPRDGAAAPELEVIVGEVRGRAAAGADGSVRTRTRRAGDAAQFMMYEGGGVVAAQGAQVTLGAGSGTVVPPKAAPLPAEPLLAAPALLDPAAGAELGRDDPRLSWTPLGRAARYVVELCADADCGRLLDRLSGLAGESLVLPELPAAAEAYWRVTAVAASGLDGFPSLARKLILVDSVRPPAPRVELLGADGEPPAPNACLASPPTVTVRALDSRGNALVASIEIDGSVGSIDQLAQMKRTGEHEIVAVVTDARGRSARSLPVRFELDLLSPTIEVLPATGAMSTQATQPSRRTQRKQQPAVVPCALGLEVAGGPDSWLPVACSGSDSAATELALEGAAAELRLRAAGGALRLGEFLDLAAGDTIVVRLGDAGCGLGTVRLRLLPSPYLEGHGRVLLELVLADRAGRTTRSDFHLETR